MSEQESFEPGTRCPNCDTVIPAGADRCLMCGTAVETAAEPPAPEQTAPEQPELVPAGEKSETVFIAADAANPPMLARVEEEAEPLPAEAAPRKRPSPVAVTLTIITVLITGVLGFLILRYQGDNTIIVMAPTPTSPPPTATITPTATATAPATAVPTATPTITLTPPPTATLPPPRAHTVTSGETLFGISFFYRVSVESIAELNGISAESAVQVNQNLLIPWPTPTPPLEIIAVEVNGEQIIADPTGCQRYEVQSGDSVVGIANQFGIQFDILAQVNRITNPDLLRPGDTLCIPEIRYGESLPPTPGPTPTITPTRPPAGPTLLYPVQNAVLDSSEPSILLQWVTVKDLTESEYYMVELRDRRDVDAIVWRGFTRDSAFRLPENWLPTEPGEREFVWRVSIVNVTDWREDGLPIYTFGGERSAEGGFTYLVP